MIVSRFILTVLLLAFVATPLLAQTDDPFLRRFADGGEVEPTALARFMFGLASSLENGKRSVQLLLDDRDRDGYRRYADALKQFHQAAERLADRPESSAARFRALAAGHEACWRLDRQISLAEAYGVSGSELRSVISSGTACNKFRRVAFDRSHQVSISIRVLGRKPRVGSAVNSMTIAI